MKKSIVIVLIVIAIVFAGILLTVLQKGCSVADKVSDPDKIISNYEEFQSIYNTCVKLNTDLCNMQKVPETDKMFEQFSKEQRMLQLRTSLNRWMEEYNAKSKMITRELWKSSALPYQLSTDQFKCY